MTASATLATLFNHRYVALSPVQNPQPGQTVVVPVWQHGSVVDYRQGVVQPVSVADPGDPFYVVAVPGVGPVGYFPYSLAEVPA